MTQTNPFKRENVLPFLLRPGMYAGEQGLRTKNEWKADAIVEWLNGPAPVQMGWPDFLYAPMKEEKTPDVPETDQLSLGL